jgi:hypothetical protein
VIDADRFGSQHIGWDRNVLGRGTVTSKRDQAIDLISHG